MNSASESWIDLVRRKVAGMRFGSVHVTVHEGRVTQIEASEKMRLPSGSERLADLSQGEQRSRDSGARD